ncbi:MAG: hypothetical protein H7Z14_09425 [Anaerolineae bacterium]|nr:hypothetical protein [Phycisphaerae bacterium]
MNLPQPTRRTCGECRACCTTCVVPELDKPINTPCVHLVQLGCGIYETRPQSCRVYDCAWLHGHFADYERPDKTGIVWSFEEIEAFDGLLVHAMLLNGSVPLERVKTMYARLQKTCAYRLMLQIVPHDLRVAMREKIHGRPVGPGVYVAVAEKAVPE